MLSGGLLKLLLLPGVYDWISSLSDRTKFALLMSMGHSIPTLVMFILYSLIEACPKFDKYKIQPSQHLNYIALWLRQTLFVSSSSSSSSTTTTTKQLTKKEIQQQPQQHASTTNRLLVRRCIQQTLISHCIAVPLFMYTIGYTTYQRLTFPNNSNSVPWSFMIPFLFEEDNGNNNNDHYYYGKLFSDLVLLPSLLIITKQIFFYMIIEDTLFYWSHRILHEIPFLYMYVHKKHHEFKSPIVIAVEHSHIIETIFGAFLPFAFGTILWPPKHPYILATWITIRIIKASEAHSGYNGPWMIFNMCPYILTTSARHDYHHNKTNQGCYGSFFTFWDWICKTDQNYIRVYGK